MVDLDAFRRDFAATLLDCADRRHRSAGGGVLTGEDLKIIALFERLAADVENVDRHVLLTFDVAMTHKRLARVFPRPCEDLLAQVGVSYCPPNATELLRWLTKQVGAEARQIRPADRSTAAFGSARDRKHPSRRRSSAEIAAPPDFLVSVAADFSAGLGIVAPMLAVWQVARGIGQWRDRAVAEGHPTVPANVISSQPSAGIRHPGLSSQVVLSFRPSASSETCVVSVRIGRPPEQTMAGTTMLVVPRSAECEAPLLRSEIGDPLTTFALAACLMLAGVGALKLWNWLDRPEAYQAHVALRPVWSRPRPLARD